MSKKVSIAILDSGVNTKHEKFTNRVIKGKTLQIDSAKKVNVIDIFGRVQQLKVINGKVVITIGYLPITITGFDQDDFTGLYTPRKVVK